MERTKIYFASDAHLGARYLEDARAAELKLVHWLDSIKDDAIAVYLLGDVFDYWYEYKYVVPKGFTRFLGKLAELSDSGIEIHIFIGNHDVWMFDYLPKEIGAIIHQNVLTTTLLGKRFFLGHGDEVDFRNVGYNIMRVIFRSKFVQLLYGSIHPRWTFAFAHNWSRHSRSTGIEQQKATYKGESSEYLIQFAKEYLTTHPEIDFFIFGHRHILLDYKLNASARLLIAGDWMHLFSFIEWDGTTLSLKQWNDSDRSSNVISLT